MSANLHYHSVSVGDASITLILHDTSFTTTFPSPYETTEHNHLYHEMLYSLDDRNSITLYDNGCGGENCLLLAHHTLAILSPYAFHKTAYYSQNSLFSIGFTYEKTKNVTNSPPYVFHQLQQILDNKSVLSATIPSLYPLLQELQKAETDRNEGLLTAVFLHLLFRIAAEMQKQQAEPVWQPTQSCKSYAPLEITLDTLYHIDKALNSEYTEDITPDSFSSRFYISPRQINRYIQSQYGQTFLQRRSFLRIQLAKKLFRQTTDTIEEIAYAVGYSSLNTFYSAFKNSTGFTPAQYRTMYLE